MLLPMALAAISSAASAPVWSRDVAPIVYMHCVSCHHPGQSAPFSLLRYEDARKHAGLIAQVTASRYMPPWKPAAGYGRFAGARRLTSAEIDTIRRWANAGAPEGNPHDAPPPPQFPNGWTLGEPDRTVELTKPYEVPADGSDEYRCFVLPTGLDRDRYVRAWEFRTNGSSALHHALIFVDATHNPKGPSEYPCFGSPGFLPSGALGGWSPGMSVISAPSGTAVHLPRGARLVAQLHFHPTGKRESAQPSIGLYFSDQPPTRPLMDISLGSRRIDIPAGDANYRVTDHFEIPVDVAVTGIIPHAHYICRDMRGWAILPKGKRRELLWIRDWDFNAQEQYRYDPPFELPAGTTVYMKFTYDNSAANVRNPSHPARRVSWGPASTDEMAGLHLQVIPVRQDDVSELGQALWGKIMREVGGGFYRTPK